jgi:hypothetical protein
MFKPPACLIGATYTRSSNEQEKPYQKIIEGYKEKAKQQCRESGGHPEIDQIKGKRETRYLHRSHMGRKSRTMATR